MSKIEEFLFGIFIGIVICLPVLIISSSVQEPERLLQAAFAGISAWVGIDIAQNISDTIKNKQK